MDEIVEIEERTYPAAPNGAEPAVVTDLAAAWGAAETADYEVVLFDGTPYGIQAKFWLHELRGDHRTKAFHLVKEYQISGGVTHVSTDAIDQLAEAKLFYWSARTGESEDAPYLFDPRNATDENGRRLTTQKLLEQIQTRFRGEFLSAVADEVRRISGINQNKRDAVKND